jgi:Zn-dependent oligopeptidase
MQISNLRLKMANLLAYKSYADFSLEKTMAKNVKSANNLLNSLIIAAKPVAEKELDALQKFAELQGADAFSVFKENGIFDKATARSFKDNILARGGSEDPMKLYIQFRKQEPSIEALLVRSGLK